MAVIHYNDSVLYNPVRGISLWWAW